MMRKLYDRASLADYLGRKSDADMVDTIDALDNLFYIRMGVRESVCIDFI